MSYTLAQIAAMVEGTVTGDPHYQISVLSPITDIIPGSLIFAEGRENLKIAVQSEAGALLLSRHETCESKPYIQVDHPFKAFIHLLHVFNPPLEEQPGIHPTAVIAENVKLGQNCKIGAYAYIGPGSKIGEGCVIKNHVSIGAEVNIGAQVLLYPHVTIYDQCKIGNRVIIHAGSVVGSDGFGYAYIDGKHTKVPHVGSVRIEDDVEIGANTVVDRATLGATVIGTGTKIDNLVQIAHSVQIGPQNIICAFTGIAGSTTTGKGVVCAANVGVSDHVRIDDGVILAARAGVPPRKHLKQGNVYLGNPARPKDKAIENELSVTRIPYLRKQIHALQEKVEALSSRMAGEETDA